LGVGLTTPSRKKSYVKKTSKMPRKGSTNRRRRAENRDEWRHALEEAKARKGL
jgi:hypothetical protein